VRLSIHSNNRFHGGLTIRQGFVLTITECHRLRIRAAGDFAVGHLAYLASRKANHSSKHIFPPLLFPVKLHLYDTTLITQTTPHRVGLLFRLGAAGALLAPVQYGDPSDG
jgi:hypothetical protein